jgi:tRNA (guanine-N7-)-methyltransferase
MSRPALDHAPRESVRTFTPRWRNSSLTAERMATLLPARAVPHGPLDAASLFGAEVPVVLEIGCGHGAAAIAYARAHPQVGVVAVDVHVPGIARMLAAAQEAGADNLKVLVGDALPFLTERVRPSSLAGVHLFFPDPWPKKRHTKRRFVQQYSLDLIADRLRPGGVLLIATDHAVYARHVREQLAHHAGFDVVEGERPSWRPSDGFEDKGLRAGRTVAEFRCTRR